MTAALSPALLDLMEHEKVIEQGLHTFIDVGLSLLAIKDGAKYHAAGYDTFEGYCRGRWGWSLTHGYRMIEAARAAQIVSPMGETQPTNERQMRPLTGLPPDEQREAWDEAVTEANGQPTAEQVAEAVDRVDRSRRPQLVPKPQVAPDVPPHPASYPRIVIDTFRELLADRAYVVLDPFAGVGGIHQLRPDFLTIGVEIEPDWARAHPGTICGDSRKLRDLIDQPIEAIATSPTYGNRLADDYNASDPEARRSYAIDLGHDLTDGNTANMHFDTNGDYENVHREVWNACHDVLVADGLLLLNCKDFVRHRTVMPVISWHIECLGAIGFRVIALRTLPMAGLPMAGLPMAGLPATYSKLSELVVVFRKESK